MAGNATQGLRVFGFQLRAKPMSTYIYPLKDHIGYFIRVVGSSLGLNLGFQIVDTDLLTRRETFLILAG